MARKTDNTGPDEAPTAVPMPDEHNSQGKGGDVVSDLPPANPLGEPVKPAGEYPNISEAGKAAAALGVETEETEGTDAVFGETIVEHPVSPTDANPNPHGQRDESVTVVPVKDKDGNVSRNDVVEGDTKITGLSDNPVHLGDGRTLAKGATAMVDKDVAKALRDSKQAK